MTRTTGRSEAVRRGKLFNNLSFAGMELLNEYARYGNVIDTERIKAMDAIMQELFGMAMVIESDILSAGADRDGSSPKSLGEILGGLCSDKRRRDMRGKLFRSDAFAQKAILKYLKDKGASATASEIRKVFPEMGTDTIRGSLKRMAEKGVLAHERYGVWGLTDVGREWDEDGNL